MREHANEVLKDVLTCLDGISRQHLPPRKASELMSSLRARHPDTSIELVWDEQAFDRSLHYDALVRPAGYDGTVSMSVCHDDALPWPLRGLQAWRDSELLRVNGVVMPVEAAIKQLDMLWQRKPLMQRLVDSCLIEAELQRRDIDVTPAEVQATMNDMRRRRGLLTAADTQAWLAASGMSPHGLTELAMKLARAEKLRDLIVGRDADAYLEQHRDSFDIVNSRVLQTPSREQAETVAKAVRAGTRSFIDAAQDAFMRDATGRTQLFYRQDSRYKLLSRSAAIANGTLSAGDLFGPVIEDDEATVIEVVSIEPAGNNAKLRSLAVAKLFEDWLREQRRAARIEWFWGSAERTADTRDGIE